MLIVATVSSVRSDGLRLGAWLSRGSRWSVPPADLNSWLNNLHPGFGAELSITLQSVGRRTPLRQCRHVMRKPTCLHPIGRKMLSCPRPVTGATNVGANLFPISSPTITFPLKRGRRRLMFRRRGFGDLLNYCCRGVRLRAISCKQKRV
jgi:hypothetical protein